MFWLSRSKLNAQFIIERQVTRREFVSPQQCGQNTDRVIQAFLSFGHREIEINALIGKFAGLPITVLGLIPFPQ